MPDSLLRKLRFDFRDTFSEGFYFDSIHSTAWIKDGVLHTDDTLVDGLEADIAMKGSVDLVRRRLDMEAVVAPEISVEQGLHSALSHYRSGRCAADQRSSAPTEKRKPAMI